MSKWPLLRCLCDLNGVVSEQGTPHVPRACAISTGTAGEVNLLLTANELGQTVYLADGWRLVEHDNSETESRAKICGEGEVALTRSMP